MSQVDLSELDGPCLIPFPRFQDARGYFQVSWNDSLLQVAGVATTFLQDNIAWSKKGVIRGLHYQVPMAQGKLVSVLEGAILDVIVDMRADSSTQMKWAAIFLSAAEPSMLWVPKGFAHGYQSLSDGCLVHYKVDAQYLPEQEVSINPFDLDLAIHWPLPDAVLNEKDINGLRLTDAPCWQRDDHL